MFTKVGEGNVLHLKAEIFCCLTSSLYPPPCFVTRAAPRPGTQHCPMVKRPIQRQITPRAGVINSCDLGQVLDLPKYQFPHPFHAPNGIGPVTSVPLVPGKLHRAPGNKGRWMPLAVCTPRGSFARTFCFQFKHSAKNLKKWEFANTHYSTNKVLRRNSSARQCKG